MPELGKEMKGQVQTAAIAELDSFKLQTRLSNQMAYLTLMTLGMSRYAANDWDGTIHRLTKALEQVKEADRNKSHADVYLACAFSYTSKGDYDRAVTAFDQAIKLKPEFAKAYAGRGIVYHYNKKDYDKAIADYTQALKLKSDYAEAYTLRGLTYYNKKDYAKAFTDYNWAIKLKPNTLAYTGRATAYSDKKDYDKAIADYTQALKLKPDLAAAYFSRGFAYRDKQDYDNAIADYTQGNSD